jgi:hypothetical protein
MFMTVLENRICNNEAKRLGWERNYLRSIGVGSGGGEWSSVMKRKRKNPNVVGLGGLGGLVRSEAKRRANRQNGRKGGLVKSRKKRIAARQRASSRPGRRKKSSRP